MPTPTNTKNDGNVQVGSRILTIGTATGGTGGVPYIAENVTFNLPTKTIERADEKDNPNGQYSYLTFITGTATLQLADSITARPQFGMEFSTKVNEDDATTTVFYLTDISRNESQGAEIKVNITFRKKIVTS
jgi:hypothetical protein